MPGWLIPAVMGAATAYGQYRANKETKNYLTGMSNTGYQRAMADMKAAGLNPILAGKLGPASTPNYQAQNIGSAYSTGYQQASSAQQMQAGARQSITQSELNEVNTAIRRSSPEAVVSRIIEAIEAGVQGKDVNGPYGAISDVVKDVVVKSKQYKINLNERMTPIINEKLIAAVIARAGEIGIKIPQELWKQVVENWSK